MTARKILDAIGMALLCGAAGAFMGSEVPAHATLGIVLGGIGGVGFGLWYSAED